MRRKGISLILTAAMVLGTFSAGSMEGLAEEAVIIEQVEEQAAGEIVGQQDSDEISSGGTETLETVTSETEVSEVGTTESEMPETGTEETVEPIGETETAESPETALPGETGEPEKSDAAADGLLVEKITVLDSAAEQKTLTLPDSVQENSAEADYAYRELADGTVEITDYTGDLTPGMRLEIPETLGGKTVTSLGENSFAYIGSLCEVVIPETVTAIGASCFRSCSALERVNLPQKLNTIPDFCFKDCEKLDQIALPDGVTSIGQEAFFFCRSLKSLTLPQSLSVIGSAAFYGCAAITEMQIPQSVTSIGASAFELCSGLKSIRLPDRLERIESRTFNSCYSLEQIALPENLKSVGFHAFGECALLEEVAFPASLEYIGPQVFWGCTLKKVYFEGKVPEMEEGEHELHYWFANSAAGNTYTGYIYVMHQYWDNFSKLRNEMSYSTKPPVEMLVWDTDTPHTWDAGRVISQPTCIQEGSIIYTCTVCGAEKTESIAPGGAHRYGAYVTTQETTALTEGSRARTCAVCGHTQTETVSKLTPTMTLNVKTVPLKIRQSTTKVKVSGLAKGDYVVSWKSNKPKIVKVNSNGKLTAGKKTGTAKVTVTLASGLTETVTVKVQKRDVATKSIEGIKKKVTLKKKQKLTLKPELIPVTSSDKVKYTSSNTKVATVSSKGVVKAKSKGKTTITVKAGKKTVKCKVTVK